MSRASEILRRQRDRDISKAARLAELPEFNAAIVGRAKKRMLRVDDFPPEVRAIVYEYGLEMVQEFINHGIRRPKSIAHLIDTVRGADQADGNPRFKLNKGPNTRRNQIDCIDGDQP